jgi:hypothetical protein
MAEVLTRQTVAARATIHHELPVAQARPRTEVDRTFGLPTALFVATGTLYFAFIGVMAIGFGNPGLIVPMTIMAVFLGMFFGVPALWVRMGPGANRSHAKSWSRFLSEGVQTNTGHLGAGEAAVQVLILPVLILVWGLGTATIAALV